MKTGTQMKPETAKDVMTNKVITIRDNIAVHDLAVLFSEKMISGAPVVDGQGKRVGVVSITDIVNNDVKREKILQNKNNAYYLHGWEDEFNEEELLGLHIEENDGLKVKDIMTPAIFEATEDTPISELADMMIRGRIHRILITKNKEIQGIVTTSDMLKALQER